MKKNMFLLLMPLLFFMAANTQAQECCDESSCCVETNFYAKLLSGVNFLQNTSLNGNHTTYQPGYIVAGSLGYSWCYGLSVEAEYAFRSNDISKINFTEEGSSRHGYLDTSSYMVNLLWDLPISSWGRACWEIQPFIGAGIGYDHQHMHSSNSRIVFDQKWNHFAWQLMAGISYPIFCNAEMTFEYIFHQGGCHFYNHTFGIGLVYNFGFLGL